MLTIDLAADQSMADPDLCGGLAAGRAGVRGGQKGKGCI